MATQTLLNAVTTAGPSTALDVSSVSKALLTITTSANFNGDVLFQGSMDGGTTWFAYSGRQIGTKQEVNRVSGTNSTVAVFFDVEPLTSLRANVTTISSGSVTVVGSSAPTGVTEVSLTGSTIPDTSPVPSKIVGATISVPIDKKTIYRSLGFSTTTALAASTAYTSASLDGIQYRRLTGRAFADQAGTLDLQHSDDGTTWDTLTSISVAASTPVKFDEPIYTRYIRIVYTNGATAQTTFRLSAYLSAE